MAVQKRVARFGRGDSELVVEDPETLKVLYDPLRLKMIGRLGEPRTAKELAEELGRPLTSLYYHLNLLVDHGLAKVEEERVNGRAVERVFRRTADQFVAHGEVGRVVDGLIDRDAGLASRVGHLQRIHRGPARADVFTMIQDITFTATDEAVRRLADALRDAVKESVPRGGSKHSKVPTRRMRLIVALGEAEDQAPDGNSGRNPERR